MGHPISFFMRFSTMPKALASDDSRDIFDWITEPEIVAKYRELGVDFLPITKFTVVDKGMMVFNQEEQIKGFIWRSKPVFKDLSLRIPTVTRPFFMCPSGSKYLSIMEGDEGDVEGFYSPVDSDSYDFIKKATAVTGRKLSGSK